MSWLRVHAPMVVSSVVVEGPRALENEILRSWLRAHAPLIAMSHGRGCRG